MKTVSVKFLSQHLPPHPTMPETWDNIECEVSYKLDGGEQCSCPFIVGEHLGLIQCDGLYDILDRVGPEVEAAFVGSLSHRDGDNLTLPTFEESGVFVHGSHKVEWRISGADSNYLALIG